MYQALIVGGAFDRIGGKASRIVQAMADQTGWPVLNGGFLEALEKVDFGALNVVVWMPNVDNDEEKFLPHIKRAHPTLLLVSSKRVVDDKYTPFDVVSRLLNTRSNLGLMIEQEKDGRFQFRVLDPLGNEYIRTDSVCAMAQALRQRVDRLQSLTRMGAESIKLPALEVTKPLPEFVALVRAFGDEFARYVNAVNPERFLGNASARTTDRITRCCHGFPAYRQAAAYLVSKRNVNKETMGENDFVPVLPDEDLVRYVGYHKPSVDTPVQVRLFNGYPNVNYMIHGHVYVDEAPFTKEKIPCGYLEEFDEIRAFFPDREASNFAVNLKGHGCLFMARDLKWLAAQKSKLITRPFPEV